VYSHFEQNLNDIIDIGFESGAKVIVCTVASNLKDNPPFASMHKQDLSELQRYNWERYYKEGIGLEANGRYKEAVAKYSQAVTIDDNYAELHYRLANCYVQLNRYGEAKESYIEARDRDTLRFRADSQINQIIKESVLDSERDYVYLVDVVKAFEKAEKTAHQMAGEELFYEHVHMNFFGNYLLAKSVYSQIITTLPADFQSVTDENVPFLSVDQCATLLAFTIWDLHKILGRVLERLTRPPFTNQIDHDLRKTKLLEQMNQLENSLSPKALDLIQQVYQRALDKNPNDWMLQNNLAEFYRERGIHNQAKKHWLNVLNTVPNFADVYNNVGALLVKEGKLNDAVDYFFHALDINPYLLEAHINLGVVLEKQGNQDGAIKHYSEALRLQPDQNFIRSKLDKIRHD
jgi:tetratricopeptide (TPR) repeat protein